MTRVIHYSVLVGGYDKAPTVQREPGVSYILFTDLPSRKVPEPWVACPMPSRDGLSLRKWSRKVKLQPHLYLPPHQVSIYSDANLVFDRASSKIWCLSTVKRRPIAIHKHPSRSCTYAEAETCKRLSFDHAEVVDAQMDTLRVAGFPENYGLTENCFIVRRDCEESRRIGDAWWGRYKLGSHRDQLSFMPVIWAEGAEDLLHQINHPDGDSRDNPFYWQSRHLKDRRVASDPSIMRAQRRALGI